MCLCVHVTLSPFSDILIVKLRKGQVRFHFCNVGQIYDHHLDTRDVAGLVPYIHGINMSSHFL